MGNQVSLRPSDAAGKIVLWDGSVHDLEQSVTVAELMLEHPEQVVVEFNAALKQKRPTPLPADKKLEMNKVYLMVPVKRGKPVGLSVEETQRILFLVNSAFHSKYPVCSSRFLPWITRFCQTTTIVEPGQKKDGEVDKNEERFDFSEFLTETLEGRPEYLNRQLSGKGWKPSLDTIKEKNVGRKLNHWLFIKS
ncbi:hypothetical protein RJT34_23213 [Clitoria ternatea]|uniref:Multidrug resistance protein ABC transporter family protein n=1 Tax=Clitoria ternatea TaxID=43366 RepID=A0AAN9FSD6_CLITE